MTKDGKICFKSREKDVIKTPNGLVYHSVIEECLFNHPKVSEVCAFGISNRKNHNKINEKIPCAWVKFYSHGLKISDQDLKKYCMKNLNKNQTPKYILIKDCFPQTNGGKYLRTEMEKVTLEELKI